jgi:hypothetical protein
MASKKKGGKKKGGAKTEAANDAPKIIVAKGGLPVGKLIEEVLFTMEEDLRISKKAATDFKDSLVVVVEREIAEGNPVNLFGLVKIVPRLHTKGSRMVNKEFGNPESPKVKKNYPAKVTYKTGQSIFMKPLKEAMPTVQKMQKKVG